MLYTPDRSSVFTSFADVPWLKGSWLLYALRESPRAIE